MSVTIPTLKAIAIPVLILSALQSMAGETRPASDSSDGTFSAGVTFSEKATAADMGLKLYPGATPHIQEGNSSSSANIGAGWGSTGFRVVVASYESTDNVEKIAAFYRQALAKFGPVLDCFSSNRDEIAAKTGLSCDSENPASSKNAFKYKVGKKNEQRIVVIQSLGSQSTFQLVHLNFKH
jgi:hypothetical protein